MLYNNFAFIHNNKKNYVKDTSGKLFHVQKQVCWTDSEMWSQVFVMYIFSLQDHLEGLPEFMHFIWSIPTLVFFGQSFPTASPQSHKPTAHMNDSRARMKPQRVNYIMQKDMENKGMYVITTYLYRRLRH